MPLDKLDGPLGIKRAAHLLRRATFGPNRASIDAFAEFTVDEALAKLFPSSPLPEPAEPVNRAGQEWVKVNTNDKANELEDFFLGWFIGQMITPFEPFTPLDPSSNNWLAYSAREKIVMFLHTHFTAISEKIGSARALYYQNQLFRKFALDEYVADAEFNFKSLTVKVSIDNAMVRLLDGNQNIKGSVNENYARELLELYSIGRGLEFELPETDGTEGDYGVYREADVQMAARILTGWDFDDTFQNRDPNPLIDLPRAKLRSNGSTHDNDFTEPKKKKFSDRFGNAVITDPADPNRIPKLETPEERAIDEIKQLVDIIYNQEETAKNICRKIYRFFVWSPHTLTEAKTIEDKAIQYMVATFKTNNYKILPVIKDLLGSEHFYEANAGIGDDNFGGLIKSPLDLALGTIRMFQKEKFPDIKLESTKFFDQAGEILSRLSDQGLKFYQPYDVAGYEAYHQIPVYHRFWINPNSMAQRYAFIRELIKSPSTSKISFDTRDFIENNFSVEANDQDVLLEKLILYFLAHHIDDNINLTEARLAYFKQQFLSGIATNWNTVWASSSLEDKQSALNDLFNALLQSPEYQLA